MTKREVIHLQNTMNAWVKKYLKYVAPIRVDGDKGHATNERVRFIKYYLGYVEARRTGAEGATAGQEFFNRMAHPRSTKFNTVRGAARGLRRRVAQRRAAQKSHDAANQNGKVAHYDGVPVAGVVVDVLDWCRAHGWRGRLVSGYRTPEYSEHLCFNMCRRPSCPGKCAGRTTNHSGLTNDRCAVDVTFYVDFRRIVANCPLQPRLHNDLPIDPVHFSPNGH
jgi:hypothetical protein